MVILFKFFLFLDTKFEREKLKMTYRKFLENL